MWLMFETVVWCVDVFSLVYNWLKVMLIVSVNETMVYLNEFWVMICFKHRGLWNPCLLPKFTGKKVDCLCVLSCYFRGFISESGYVCQRTFNFTNLLKLCEARYKYEYLFYGEGGRFLTVLVYRSIEVGEIQRLIAFQVYLFVCNCVCCFLFKGFPVSFSLLQLLFTSLEYLCCACSSDYHRSCYFHNCFSRC